MPPQGSAPLLDDLKRVRAARMGRPSPAAPPVDTSAAVRAPEQSQADYIKSVLDDLGIGFGKGAGETAVGLGNVVHHIPIVGNLTDKLSTLLGPEGTDPNAAFKQTSEQMGLKADNTTQSVGKFGEQLAEMMTTAGPVKKGITEGAVRMIPNSASAGTMGILNKLGAMLGRTSGEGLVAGSDAMLHNDSTPGQAATIAAAGPLVGEGAALAAPLMKNPNIQKILALIAGIGGMHLAGGLSDVGLGAGLGSYGLSRQLATQMMRSPKGVQTVQRVARRGIPAVTRAIAAADSQSRQP